MSSAPLRSPTLRPHRMKKDESFLGKLGGTLARKKKAKEVSDLQEEGRHAINSPMSPASADIHPEDTLLEENEERTMIDPTSKDDPKFKELVKVLIDWINDVLVEERIIVKQLEEDLYDGQVLQKLLEKLAGCKLNVAEVTQSEIGQKQKLQTVLEAVHGLLRPHGWALQWTVDSIHGKNLVAILHLLVSLAMHFRAPIRLPEHVSVQVVVVRKREGLLHSSHVTEELTTTTEMMMGRFELVPPLRPDCASCATSSHHPRALLTLRDPAALSLLHGPRGLPPSLALWCFSVCFLFPLSGTPFLSSCPRKPWLNRRLPCDASLGPWRCVCGPRTCVCLQGPGR
ncbi:beta-parvin isoform X2 [Ursus maritimus]|uniref:Beta-parvin isoform X2 n=1 Tax=Ursus maritimus TaxID=29073 RepID=A0A8M1GPQ1_URSMA|nr:beta-parvin isoform X2 [Ursus maritimus]